MAKKFSIILSIFFVQLALFACTKEPDQPVKVDEIVQRFDDLPAHFSKTNALFLAYIAADGKVHTYTKGQNVNAENIDENTIFEGASLSKTCFAYIYWQLLKSKKIEADSVELPLCNNNKNVKYSPFSILAQKVQFTTDSCVNKGDTNSFFTYQELGYLALQQHIETKLQTDLQKLANTYIFIPEKLNNSSFIWNDTNSNYVHAYIDDEQFLRNINYFKKPKANGTLYISGKDLLTFTSKLMTSSELDSLSIISANVPGFEGLFWGRGIGLEFTNNKKICWQWGSNWSFNSFVLINQTDNTALICLTNSIWGGWDIQAAFRHLTGLPLRSFDYIGSL